MRRTSRLLPVAVAAFLLASCTSGGSPTPPAACPSSPPAAGELDGILAEADRAAVVTNKGEFAIELAVEDPTVALASFVSLARCGFYDGISFHRVVPGFVAQAGDPQTRDNHADFEGLGTGGPGYRFEIELPSEDTRYGRYVVALANAMQYDPTTGEILSGRDTNGSQFFVMLDDAPALRPYYSLLGQVADGTDVVDAIGQVPTNTNDVPLDPVIIETIRIEAAAESE